MHADFLLLDFLRTHALPAQLAAITLNDFATDREQYVEIDRRSADYKLLCIRGTKRSRLRV